jgi:hypothetical protein
VFAGNDTKKVLEAMHDFATNYPDDKAGTILVTNQSKNSSMWAIFVFYDGPQPPKGIFDKFKAVPPIEDTTKTRSYLDLINDNSNVIVYNKRYQLGTETTPVIKGKKGLDLLLSMYDR